MNVNTNYAVLKDSCLGSHVLQHLGRKGKESIVLCIVWNNNLWFSETLCYGHIYLTQYNAKYNYMEQSKALINAIRK